MDARSRACTWPQASWKLAIDITTWQNSNKFGNVVLDEQANAVVLHANPKCVVGSSYLLNVWNIAPVRRSLHIENRLPHAGQDSIAANPFHIASEARAEFRSQLLGSRYSMISSRPTNSVCRPSSMR